MIEGIVLCLVQTAKYVLLWCPASCVKLRLGHVPQAADLQSCRDSIVWSGCPGGHDLVLEVYRRNVPKFSLSMFLSALAWVEPTVFASIGCSDTGC